MQETEAIYINNAGLVLTWPYLAVLFERAGLLSNGAFADVNAQNKAVELLHYLIYVETPQEDTGMELNKVLCGLNPSYPTVLTNTVGPEWPQLRASMWEALINNWSTIKNTSIEGLLESFIMRQGKLHIDNREWQLNVEQKAIDVLLNSLPWSIATFRLQWMKTALHTHWR